MPRKTKTLRREHEEIKEQDHDTLKEIIAAAKLPLKESQLFEIQRTRTVLSSGKRTRGAWSWLIPIDTYNIGSQFYFAETMKAWRSGWTKFYPLPDSSNDVEIIIMSMKR